MNTPHNISAETETGMFPIVKLWPSRVDLAELLDEIRRTIRRFIVCDEEILDAVTLWVTFTWLIDWIQTAPILVISAAEKGCGKTQLLTLVGQLCRRPLGTSNMTSAVVYRAIEAYSPTLLIDEADAFVRGDKEFQSILNSGHSRGMDKVWRVAGKDQGLQSFRTWGAKAIAGIGTFLNETTLDRSIRIELRRKRPDETAEKLLHTAAPAIFSPLREKLARFAEDTGDTIGKLRPEAPAGLNDRAQDNWGPLLSIAEHAGGRWPEAAQTAALQLFGRLHEALSVSAELLSDIRDIFERTGTEKIRTYDLLAHLNADEEKRWATYCRGRAMTPRPLAELLRGYRIQPHQLGGNGRNPRGYSRDQFEDAFMRYLPAKAPESAPLRLPKTTAYPDNIPKLTEMDLAKWTLSSPTTPTDTAANDMSPTDKFPHARHGHSLPPTARRPLLASRKIAKNQISSGIAGKWEEDLDGIEL